MQEQLRDERDARMKKSLERIAEDQRRLTQ